MNVLDILCLGLLEPAQHGLSQKAPITNSMVVTWIVAVGLIVSECRSSDVGDGD